jgi:hypothetical protein
LDCDTKSVTRNSAILDVEAGLGVEGCGLHRAATTSTPSGRSQILLNVADATQQ